MYSVRFLVLLFTTCMADKIPYRFPGDKPGDGTKPYGDPTLYSRTIIMDPDHVIVAKWDLDEENDAIIFHVFAKTLGWVGFGLSPNGGMAGSDIVIGWVDDTGNVEFTDRHSTGESVPVVDGNQDYELLEAKQNETHTIFRFKRKLDTCDPNDWPIDKVGTMRLIYAYGLEDPDPQIGPTYHEARRGTKSVHLTPLTKQIPKIPDDAFDVDFRMNNYEVEERDTQYVCQIFKFPVSTKHHAVKTQPLIQPGNEDIVHHIITYNCYGGVVEGHEGTPVECYTANMPPAWGKCTETSIIWAIGGVDFYYPEEAGFSVGAGVEDPTHVMIEMHYDNPQELRGRVDSSGVRFVLTPTLRQYDVGILNVLARYDGPFWQIPPHYEEFKLFGHCPSECTKEGYKMHPQGVKMFANLGHMHLSGTEIMLRHFRDGKELPLIDVDKHYDFNLQDMRYLPKEVIILPGDELLTECKFDSRKWIKSQKSGISTQEEMCINNPMFYPRAPFVRCKTFIDIPFTLKHMLNITDVTHDSWNFGAGYMVINSPPPYAGLTHDVILDEHVDWTNVANRHMYQEIQKWGPIRSLCQNTDGSWLMFDKLMPPKCVEVYRDPEEDERCPAYPKPRIPDRCVGPNPFPDAITMVSASPEPEAELPCQGYDCEAGGASHKQFSLILASALIVLFVVSLH